MKNLKKFVFHVNELSLISLIMVLSALIYTVYVMNSDTDISPQKSQAAGPVCYSAFTAVAAPSPTPPSCAAQPVDLMFVMDRSSSMNNKETVNGVTKTKLEWSKQAVKDLIDKIAQSPAAKNGKVRVGISSFGRSLTSNGSSVPSKLHIKLTNLSGGLSTVQSALTSVKYEGSGTCIVCGERIGTTQFVFNPGPSGVKNVVILTSDGRGNKIIDGIDVSRTVAKDAAIKEAQVFKSVPISATVFVAAYAGNSDSLCHRPTVLGIASSPGTCRVVPNAAGWDDVLNYFNQQICPGYLQLNSFGAAVQGQPCATSNLCTN